MLERETIMKLISLPLLYIVVVHSYRAGAKSGKFPKSAKSPPPLNRASYISFLQFGSRKVPLGAKKDRVAVLIVHSDMTIVLKWC